MVSQPVLLSLTKKMAPPPSRAWLFRMTVPAIFSEYRSPSL